LPKANRETLEEKLNIIWKTVKLIKIIFRFLNARTKLTNQKMINNELKGHFLNLYMLALSDNNFDEKELETILRIGEEKGISQKAFEEIIINPTSVEIKYPTDFIDKIKLLYDFTRVIWADKIVDDDEKTSFLKFCIKFGFEAQESEELFVWLLDLAKNETPTYQLDNEIKKLTN
jgi:hypothetical protein